jgi:D-alanyl-D-alanine carboxypeptidase
VYDDQAILLDYGFNNFTIKTIARQKNLAVSVPVVDGESDTVTVQPERDLMVAISRWIR